jgi:16S rRNA (adenine1518-N6/adenine1519-N6)-dimethyltransferase
MQKPDVSAASPSKFISSRKNELSGREEVLEFLRRHRMAPRKALGQHWLIDPSVAERIVRASLPAGGFLEIGPGAGILTRYLIRHAPVVAVDVDPRSGECLEESAPGAKFVLGDILRLDLREITKDLPSPRVVVSNLPFNIATAVGERLYEEAELFERCVLMFQREVAQRLIAAPGDRRRGPLSVLFGMKFRMEWLGLVLPGSFYPPPEVSGALLRWHRRTEVPALSSGFRDLVFAGFRAPRKTLENNLCEHLVEAGMERKVAREWVQAILREAGIEPRQRPHQLKEEDWLRLMTQWRFPRN